MKTDLIPKTYYQIEVEKFAGDPTVIFWMTKWVIGKRKETLSMINPSFWFLFRQLLHTLPYPVFMQKIDRVYLHKYLAWKFPDPLGSFVASTFYLRKHW